MFKPLTLVYHDPTLRMVVLAFLLTGTMAASISPYQSLIGIELFGFSDGYYAIIMLASASLGVASSILVGILTDQSVSRRRMAIFAGALLVLGGLVLSTAPAKWSFILTHAIIWPIAFTLYGQLFALARLAASVYSGAERNGIMAAIRALFALPFIVILPIWAYVFSQGVSLLVIYIYVTCASALIFLLIAKSWPADGTSNWSDEKSGLTFRQSLGEIANAYILNRVFLTGAIAAGTTLYVTVIGLLFHESAARSTADTALFVGIVAGLEAPFMLATATLLTRYSKTSVLTAGALFYSVFLCVFALSVSQPWVWALTVPAAIGAAITLSVPIAYLQDLMADRPGAGGSLLALNQVAGQIFAALIFAVGTAISGYVVTALIGAAVVSSAAIALYIIDYRAGKVSAPSAS